MGSMRTRIGGLALTVVLAAAGLLLAAPASAEELPDLSVRSVTAPPVIPRGDKGPVIDTTVNGAPGRARPSTTSYFLSESRTLGRNDIRLRPGRKVGALDAGLLDRGGRDVKVPKGAPTGRYFLLACADGQGAIDEADESNNCRAAPDRVKVAPPGAYTRTMSITPSSWDYGDIGYGEIAFKVFTVTNTGNLSIAIWKLKTRGSGVTATSTCPTDRLFSPGQTCTETVIVTGRAQGQHEGSLTAVASAQASATFQFNGLPAPPD